MRHGKQSPTGAGDLLTHVKVNKGVGSIDLTGGANSDGTKSALSCDGVISFLGGLHVRTKLDSTMLVEFQTASSDDAFGADGTGRLIFSGDGIITKYGNED